MTSPVSAAASNFFFALCLSLPEACVFSLAHFDWLNAMRTRRLRAAKQMNSRNESRTNMKRFEFLEMLSSQMTHIYLSFHSGRTMCERDVCSFRVVLIIDSFMGAFFALASPRTIAQQ